MRNYLGAVDRNRLDAGRVRQGHLEGHRLHPQWDRWLRGEQDWARFSPWGGALSAIVV
jgi:hypothetical protein